MNTKLDLKAFKETLKTWVNFETPTGDENRLNEFSSLVCYALENAGAHTAAYDLPGGMLIHAVKGTGVKRCVLMGHMDTVFGLNEAEKYDEENGRLYGAGVLDMKSGLLMLTKVFNQVSLHMPDDWRIEALINSDEERGSKGSYSKMLAILKGADIAFSYEGNKENAITVSRKGVCSFQLTARGVQAHTSAGSEKEKSAIYKLSRAMNQIYILDMPNDMSLNIGTIEGGRATNIVADRAELKGEIRALSEEEAEAMLLEIRKISENSGCEFSVLSKRPCMPENKGTYRLFDIVKDNAKALGKDVFPRHAGGGGDAAYAALAGVSVIDGMGPEGQRAHTRREYVTEDSIPFKYALSVRSILDCMEKHSL